MMFSLEDGRLYCVSSSHVSKEARNPEFDVNSSNCCCLKKKNLLS
jgi:hypothetical protein